MTSHYLAVPDESQGRQALGEGMRHHFVRAQRHEFEEYIQYEFMHIVRTNINMTGELSAHRIYAHCHTSKIVFVQKSGLIFDEIQNRLAFVVSRRFLGLID